MHAAQVLLTSFDLSVRMHYLNARQALRRLLAWRCVPVVNENDTTTTDEITFGDNDFLAAQVALLLGARTLVLLTDTAGLHTADPRHDPEARLIESVDDFAELDRYEIGDRTSPYGSGGMRSKVAAAGMASAAGIPAVITRRNRGGDALARLGGRAGRNPVRRPPRADAVVQALAAVGEAEPRPGDRRRRRRAGAGRARLEPAARLVSPGSRASSRPATR